MTMQFPTTKEYIVLAGEDDPKGYLLKAKSLNSHITASKKRAFFTSC